VDSSDNRLIEDLVGSFLIDLPLIYLKSTKKYPGEKRNQGASAASFKWLAFLDVGTIPRSHWLETNLSLVTRYEHDVVFGRTKYRALNHFQELLRAATYGRLGVETTPGTLLKSGDFVKSGGFIEKIRAGDDQEWRSQLRDVCKKCASPKEITLDYSNLPNSLFKMQRKYFIYYIHSSKVRSQKKIRDIYLCLLLIFSSLIITQWNYLISGWDSNPLFIPNITKIYVLSIVVISILYIITRRLFIKPEEFSSLHMFTKFFLFGVISLIVYFWNYYVINDAKDSLFFIPHITKIYVALILISSYLYRGVALPLRLGVKRSFIFPKNWIILGFIGLSLDIVKIPGMLIGIFLAPFQKNLSKKGI